VKSRPQNVLKELYFIKRIREWPSVLAHGKCLLSLKEGNIFSCSLKASEDNLCVEIGYRKK